MEEAKRKSNKKYRGELFLVKKGEYQDRHVAGFYGDQTGDVKHLGKVLVYLLNNKNHPERWELMDPTFLKCVGFIE